ncbi:hypothetical protein [Modestobacter marinus]|uniref:hypothetical protein n=1 Tax=Modestobacter marinus TaxID=477641 RepID=UPI001C95CF00|nr:hypothetical protein [Modestobacter marinus]
MDGKRRAWVPAELRGGRGPTDARRRVADLTAGHGSRSAGHAAAWAASHAVIDRWSTLIREAAAAGHSSADDAQAAGCARPSLHGHLRR